MGQMTVLELFQCVFWGVGSLSPILLGMLSVPSDKDKPPGSGLLTLAAILQTVMMLAAFKAGGKP